MHPRAIFSRWLGPEAVETGPPPSAEAGPAAGTIALRNSRPSEARLRYAQARVLGPPEGRIDQRLALTGHALGRPAEAAEAWQVAVRSHPFLGPPTSAWGSPTARWAFVPPGSR